MLYLVGVNYWLVLSNIMLNLNLKYYFSLNLSILIRFSLRMRHFRSSFSNGSKSTRCGLYMHRYHRSYK